MISQAFPLVIACLLAAVLGFTAHRASVCTVRAVAEIISARSAFMLVSIGKSALWVIAFVVPVFWLMPAAAAGIGGWQFTAGAFAGGLIFGVGAAINGGCAYSTMARLADGEMRMAVSLCGFALGVFAFVALVDLGWLTRPRPAPALIGSVLGFAPVLSLLLLGWAIFEVLRIWRRRPSGLRLHDMLLAPQYRLSSAALVVGAAGTAIFLLIGSPGYTITLQNLVQGAAGLAEFPSPARWLLLLAVVAGMLASTVQRGSFRLEWRPQRSWLRNLFGGALMGLGTAMPPGGNDALILYSIPSFSPHAIPTYLALLIGAAVGLLAMRHIAGLDTRVVCRDDMYRAELQPPGAILNAHPPSAIGGR